ncbi:MAG: isoprenylcysteine carboxylmethyltransferase family protein [Planctomycetaceae bacterium]
MNSTNSPPDGSKTTIVVKMLLQMLIFWGLYFVVWPALLWRTELSLGWAAWQFGGPTSRTIGLTLFLIGGGLALWGSLALARVGAGMPLLNSDRPKHLVVAGPYRHLRHPMAVAGVLQGVAAGLVLGSPLATFSGLLGGAIWFFRKRPREERYLEEQFGEEYRRYRAAVPGYIPRRTGWDINGENADDARGP